MSDVCGAAETVKRHIEAKDRKQMEEWVKFACWGHPVNDVAAIAVGMLLQCIVLKTDSQEEAMRFAGVTFRRMLDVIAKDYDELRADCEHEPSRN